MPSEAGAAGLQTPTDLPLAARDAGPNEQLKATDQPSLVAENSAPTDTDHDVATQNPGEPH
jgi:hypothetical protein